MHRLRAQIQQGGTQARYRLADSGCLLLDWNPSNRFRRAAPLLGAIGLTLTATLDVDTSLATFADLGSENDHGERTQGDWDYRFQVKVSGVPALIMTPYLAGTYTLAPIVATLPAQSMGSTN